MKYSANAGDSVDVQPAGMAGQKDRLLQGVVNESANAPICLWRRIRGSGRQRQSVPCAVDHHGQVMTVSLMLLSHIYQTAYSSRFPDQLLILGVIHSLEREACMVWRKRAAAVDVS